MNFNESCEAIKAMTAKWPETKAKLVDDEVNGPAGMKPLQVTVAGGL